MNLKMSNGVTFLQSQGFVGIGIQGLHIVPPIKFFFQKPFHILCVIQAILIIKWEELPVKRDSNSNYS